jgi:hypothetical protein
MNFYLVTTVAHVTEQEREAIAQGDAGGYWSGVLGHAFDPGPNTPLEESALRSRLRDARSLAQVLACHGPVAIGRVSLDKHAIVALLACANGDPTSRDSRPMRVRWLELIE